MNKWQKYQILGVSFLVAGVGTIMLPVNVDAAKSAMEACLTGGNTKAECECQAAVESGSEKALQSFLKRYPNADTICNATASTGVVVEGDDNLDGPNPGNSSGTSSGSSGTSSGSSGTSSGSSGTSSGSSGTSSGTSSGLNNGHGNLDQDAPGNSGSHNNAENSGNSGQGNSGSGGGGHSF